MKKSRTVYIVWFIVLLALSAMVNAPLHYWKGTIQSKVAEGVTLHQLNGRLWAGNISVSVPRLEKPIAVQWRFAFPNMHVQMTHPAFQGWGMASFSIDGIDMWVDEARLDMGLFQPMAKSNGIQLNGSSFIIDRLFIQLGYDTFVPRLWRGEGRLASITADYAFGNERKKMQMNGLTAEWLTQEQASSILIRSQEGHHLLSLEPTRKQELEISIMPSLLNEVGLSWSGRADYPVAVLVEPLF
ncbi:hypothetical protein [Marinomonas algicola]|uniref:hypothetical protein n=1 Tax=Marinomonas algicola TaxID=2773454 RepID=UPI00174BA124|nr:hypothetical protein [Marinomonas algicola]